MPHVIFRNGELLSVVLSVIVLSFGQAFAPTPQSQPSFRKSSSRLRWSTASDYLSGLSTDLLGGDTKQCFSRPPGNELDASETPLLGGDILPMTWGGKRLCENLFRVGLPPQLLEELRAYANRMGITDFYRGLVVEDRPYNPGTEGAVTFGEQNWMVQRPKSHWKSNMHWASPADEAAHDDYLGVLSAGGFDKVLEKIGAYFDLEGLSAYHLSFIGVSQCEKGFIHADVNDSGVMAFNMIIPLILEDEGPELEILSDDETATRFYKYQYNVASMLGDDALHATAPCDYLSKGTMRLAATVYVGDITPDNVYTLLLSLTQSYPPPGNAQHLLDRAGMHWSKSDPSMKLPLSQELSLSNGR